MILVVIAITLPAYWLAEPGRQAGAVEKFHEEFVVARARPSTRPRPSARAATAPTASAASKNYTLLNANGDFVAQVDWKAPALNTVLFRFSKDEVKYILNYGRPGTPMPAWGAPGGGPLTDQQLDDVIAYLYSIQLSSDDSQTAVQSEIDTVCKPDAANNCTLYGTTDAAKWKTLGEALFNLGEYDGFAGGAYSCGRCHTQGWSYGMPGVVRWRRRLRPEPHRRQRAAPVRDLGRSRSSSSAPAPRTARATAGAASAAARCRASASTPAPSIPRRRRPPG